MKNISDLIKSIRSTKPRTFKAFKEIDYNFSELLGRISKLEERNLKYHCRAWRSTDKSILSSVPTLVDFDFNEYPQFGNMHDGTTDPEYINIQRDAVYSMSCGASFRAILSAQRVYAAIILTRATGATTLRLNERVTVAGQATYLGCSTEFYCRVGDLISLEVFQASGLPLALLSTYAYSPYLAVTERREDLDPSKYGLMNPDINTF